MKKKISFTESSRLKEIGQDTFENCLQLEEIVIPKTVESISKYAFTNYISLERVILQRSFEFEVPIKEMFAKCIMLKSVMCNGKELLIDKVPSQPFPSCLLPQWAQ